MMRLTPSLGTANSSYLPVAQVGTPLNGSRLVETGSGTIEIVPLSIGEVVGERLLKPAFDLLFTGAQKSFQVLKDASAFIDQIASRVFPDFPGAEATFQVIGSPQVPACESPMGFEEVIANLSAADGLIITADPKFRENFTKAVKIREELEGFVNTKSKYFSFLHHELNSYSNSYKKLYKEIDNVLLDIVKNEARSEYWPFKSHRLVLEFPHCTVNITPDGAPPSVMIKEAHLYYNGVDLLSEIEGSSLTQGDTLITQGLMKKILTDGAVHLRIFNIDFSKTPHTPAQFIALFSDQTIQDMQTFLNREKAEINRWAQNQQAFLEHFFKVDQEQIHKIIQDRVRKIYLEHQKIVEKENKAQRGSFEIQGVKRSGKEISSWKVVKIGFFTNTDRFQFSIEGSSSRGEGGDL